MSAASWQGIIIIFCLVAFLGALIGGVLDRRVHLRHIVIAELIVAPFGPLFGLAIQRALEYPSQKQGTSKPTPPVRPPVGDGKPLSDTSDDSTHTSPGELPTPRDIYTPHERLPESYATPPLEVKDWLQTDGPVVLFRYALYLRSGCDRSVRAVGNWGSSSWEKHHGLFVKCLQGDWLKLDLTPEIHARTIRYDERYCLDFVGLDGQSASLTPESAPDLFAVSTSSNNGRRFLSFIVHNVHGSPSVEMVSAGDEHVC